MEQRKTFSEQIREVIITVLKKHGGCYPLRYLVYEMHYIFKDRLGNDSPVYLQVKKLEKKGIVRREYWELRTGPCTRELVDWICLNQS